MDKGLLDAWDFEGELRKRDRIRAERDRRMWGPAVGSRTAARRFAALDGAAFAGRGIVRHGNHRAERLRSLRAWLAEVPDCPAPRLP